MAFDASKSRLQVTDARRQVVRQAFPDLDPNAVRDVRVLVLTGYGLNCEDESSAAFECLGADVRRRHLGDVFTQIEGGVDPFADVSVLVFIGGFSFGDHVASGRILANRLRHRAGDAIASFVDRRGLVIGVCNGFQTLVKLGLLPALERKAGEPLAEPSCSLVANVRLGYRNQWVRVLAQPDSPCVWTRGLNVLELPARHGEGQLIALDDATWQSLESRALIPLRYVDAAGQPTQSWPENPNGSRGGAAALCDPSGRLFGLMPHPEANIYNENHPAWFSAGRVEATGQTGGVGAGLSIFANGVRAVLAG